MSFQFFSEESSFCTGKSVTLKRFAVSNITNSYLAWLNDKELMRYSNQRFLSHSHASCEKYFNSFINTNNLFLAILFNEKLAGTMTAYISKEHGTADIGIMIGKEFQGQGLATDAWGTLMKYLLKSGMRKVTGGTLNCNRGMIAVMTKCGMKPDGVRIKQEIVSGMPEDILYFCRFADD